MPFCAKCGTKYDDNANFCPNCGVAFAKAQTDDSSQKQQSDNNNSGINFEDSFKKFNNTADSTDRFDKTDIEQNKAMAILAYLGILVIIPIAAAGNSRFARFHSNQGLILLITELIWSAAVSASTVFLGLFRLKLLLVLFGIAAYPLSLVLLVFIILGIYNAATGRAKELPIIGRFKILQ